MSALSKHESSVGYPMQAREFTSAAEMMAARAEVHQRFFKPEPKPAPKPVAVVSRPEPTRLGPKITVLEYAPLNMLSPPSWKFLVAFAAVRRGVSADEIMGQSRGNTICQARHDAVALVALYSPERTPLQIARLFGRDRATIVHSLKVRASGPLPLIAAPVVAKAPAPKAAKPASKASPTRRKRNPAVRKATVLQSAVTRAYAYGVPLKDVADEYGSTTGSLKVIAHNLGLYRAKSKYGEPATL